MRILLLIALFFSPLANACGESAFQNNKPFAKQINVLSEWTQYVIYYPIHNEKESPEFLSSIRMILPSIAAADLALHESEEREGYYSSEVVIANSYDIADIEFLAPYNYGEKEGNSFSLCLPNETQSLKNLLDAGNAKKD